MDLDRVAQSALNGALQTTRADVGALLILDREWDVFCPEPKPTGREPIESKVARRLDPGLA